MMWFQPGGATQVKMAGVETHGGGDPNLGLLADLNAEVDGRHSGGEDMPDDECCDAADAGLHRCPRCDYDTLSRLAFVSHLAECTGDMTDGSVGENCDGSPDRLNRKMFVCDVCNMKFSNGANMRRHKMRHTGVKPYECRVCQKRFFRKDHLAEHFTTHTKTLPYQCPICNRGFQRQIAMRAHFQNEHVGQHDMVKSCPLCSYRAGSMKSLRVHFFNRHGIDLDNPGPTIGVDNGSNPAVNGGLGATLGSAIAGALSGAGGEGQGTPPMHFLTPHIEISMADAPGAFSPGQGEHVNGASDMNGERESPISPQSVDSCGADTNMNGSALSASASPGVSSPSVCLGPVKQELPCGSGSTGSGSGSGEEAEEDRRCSNGAVNLSTSRAALIKVSPLTSLLRDEGKRGRHVVPRSRQHPELLPVLPAVPPSDPLAQSQAPAPAAAPAPAWRSPPKLQCAFCGIAFPDQTLYFLHKGCHSDTNPWKCNICGEQCCSVYDFNAHLLSKSHQ